MKRDIILCIGLLFILGRLAAQTSGSNWIKTRTAVSESGTAVTDITYYNGLGLPSQTIRVNATVNGYDWVAPIEYDALLRSDAKSHLPFESTYFGGEELYDVLADQRSFYEERYGESYAQAFSENVYEASPLDRVRKQALPGYMNSDVRYSTIGYRTNAGGEVRKLSVDGFGALVSNGYYAAGTLSCTETTDADGRVGRVFTDGRGQTLLKRSVNGSELLDTYSVYDDYGRLRWVVSPEGSKMLGSATYAPTGAFAGQYCYVYSYDGRGRVVEKRLPGCDVEYLVYDAGDRVVMSQDGNLRERKKWMTFHYDDLGRLQTQSLISDTIATLRHVLQCSFDNKQTPDLYNDNSTLLIRQCIYDRYPSYLSASGLGFEQIEGLTGGDGQSLCFGNTQGYLTCEKMAVLAGGQITGYHERACYYDYKGRRIQSVEKDSQNGKLYTSTRYDFVGNIVAEQERYVLGTIDDRIDRTYVYDNRSRLLSESTIVNGDAQGALVRYAYDEQGRICGKTYGPGAGAIHETMEYNMQGWLTNRSSELFAMSLRYYDQTWLYATTTPSYTGNIVEWEWQHTGTVGGNDPQNCYAFSYDGVSRLTDIRQYVNGVRDDRFVENYLSYDYNGNIRSLKRYKQGALDDNYVYRHNGNQLISLDDLAASAPDAAPRPMRSAPADNTPRRGIMPVDSIEILRPLDLNDPGSLLPLDPNRPPLPFPLDPILPPDNPEPDPQPDPQPDPKPQPEPEPEPQPEPEPEPDIPMIDPDTLFSGSAYIYDAAGNMLYDAHTGLNIRYNHLNLIEKVMRGDTIVAKYSYLSDGTKLSATDSVGNGLYYSGSLVYGKQDGALRLESCGFSGGRFVATAVGIEPHYFITDHLGSVRAVVNSSGEVLERNDYYPFGKRWDDGLLSDNRYRYNGKENQSFLNNPYTDYGARQYDPDAGIWHGMDKLSEMYTPISPYAFCANNPIKFVDSDGRDIKIWYKDGNGQSRSYVYSGGAVTVNNTFVSQVVAAYRYNKRNTGGDNPMTKAVEGNDLLNIMQTDGKRLTGIRSLGLKPRRRFYRLRLLLTMNLIMDWMMHHHRINMRKGFRHRIANMIQKKNAG